MPTGSFEAHASSSSPGILGSQPGDAGSSEMPPLSRTESIDASWLAPVPPANDMSVYIELRRLTKAERNLYESGFSERSVTDDEAFPEREMEAVIGEVQARTQKYYYVRLLNGQAFRFPAERFANQHPHLVKAYEQKKEDNELEPFDPTASYIHPTSRIRNATEPPAHNAATEFTPDYETPESDGDGKDYEQDSDSPAAMRRSTRKTKNGGKPLPFSPVKTRTKAGPDYSAIYVDDSDDEDPLARPMSPIQRKSTRSRRSARANLDDQESDDEGQESNGDGETPQPKKKKVSRSKAARPAHGRFREVSTLDYDSDEETAVLRAHRGDCAKCNGLPAHVQLRRLRKKHPKKRKARREDDFEDDDDDDDVGKIVRLGGWVRCLRCPVVAHWGCLAKTQRDEIIRAANGKAREEWLMSKPSNEDEEGLARHKAREPSRRSDLSISETTEFICGSCMRGGICYCCKEVALLEEGVVPTVKKVPQEGSIQADGDVEMSDAALQSGVPEEEEHENDSVLDELLFRCSLCKRMAHYAHLPPPPEDPDAEYSAVDLAEYYQQTTGWQCADCRSFVYSVEFILAWRPYPKNAVEPKLPPGTAPHFKDALPREYLIKWTDRSYKRVQWVPHMWLLATSQAKLKNFLERGSAVTLLPEPAPEAHADGGPVDDPVSTFGVGAEEDLEGSDDDKPHSGVPDAVPDAENLIQPAWKTVDRALDVLLWSPQKRLARRRQGKKKNTNAIRTDSDPEPDDFESEREAAYDTGEQPSMDLVETVEEFCKRNKKQLSVDDIDRVVWGFFKWKDLGYDNATWDSPPRPATSGYAAFESAFRRFVEARQVKVRQPSKQDLESMKKWPKHFFMRKYAFTHESQPQLGQSEQYKLMPFQVDGVNWLCDNWCDRQHCILADEMGLGKTVQIVTFIGSIVNGVQGSYPACPVLVVVPNSTITNWVREFERWAPNLRVVPFYGDAKSRDVIKQYELFHSTAASGIQKAKYHVLVTTYETITTARDSMSVFKSTPRWEALIVDEGQRLKGDSSLLFKKLRELNLVHRIILTGTPLNNNIRELFNLMHFLDPDDWNNLQALEKEYEELTEEKIKQLHERLRPYFLRRVKSEVLQLPPKNEVIVPISMTPLQKETYKSILTQNVKALQFIATAGGTKVNAAANKTNINNMLMQLRKCLQHPYLTTPDMEPTGLSAKETHENLVSASAKLMMLRMLLPKLKARGHRVLLFSQFVIMLDIIEDYLKGEGLKFLRLDGNTKQANRQKDMDHFNKPDSDVFIYILSTRAGGVGINLWSADTVIIFDPDFNPHQDLQAIARAHRYGQQKTCLVFKFMMKDSAEERIMQTGKKKLVLDHLIVQKMDDEEKDVQSILTFGAQALFEADGATARDIHYSDHDIDKLIEKTETEGDQQESASKEAAAFSFAKIWSADKDALEDLDTDNAELEAQDNAWARTLQRIAEERAKEELVETTGRGTRRKAAPVFAQQYDYDDGPSKVKKGKRKAKVVDDEDVYAASEHESAGSSAGSASGGDVKADLAELNRKASPERIVLYPAPTTLPRVEEQPCGLCGLNHGDQPCFMTERSENLAQYRYILMNHAGDESLEDRKAAIAVIDETLHKRGELSLIFGQPLHPVENPRKQQNGQSVPIVPKTPIANLNGLNGSSMQPPSRPMLRPVAPQPTTAGSSKRPLSPLQGAGPPLKKLKESGYPTCVVCGRSPGHKLKKCPVVREGSERIEKEMRRLIQSPSNTSIVAELSSLHRKYEQREMLSASTTTAFNLEA
ncbi:SNF2 family N-terminal domain-containing protein [Cytidiella melzeri]|nr:SNF2 family N-terminal domain-containing protein [Cytidiella melzeri]